MSFGNPNNPVDGSDEAHHHYWMQQALDLAAAAGTAEEVPVGAVIVKDQQVIAVGENRRQRDHDPTAHAEILALRAAGQALGTWYLNDCTLYVTLEPCPMCAGALVQARLGQLVYGTSDPKTGAVRTVMNLPDSPCSYHRLSVIGGVLADTCRQQLQDWFAEHRRQERRGPAASERRRP